MKKIERAVISVTDKTGFRLAKKFFKLPHRYDGAISDYLDKVEI